MEMWEEDMKALLKTLFFALAVALAPTFAFAQA